VLQLRAKILKIGVLHGVGQYLPNFHVEGDIPTNHFCKYVADSFHTKKTGSRLS